MDKTELSAVITQAAEAAAKEAETRITALIKSRPALALVDKDVVIDPKAQYAISRALDADEAARKLGFDAIKMGFLFNGGAVVALLALLGSEAPPTGELGWVIGRFAGGAFFALFAAGMAYLSQHGFSERHALAVDATLYSNGWTGSVAILCQIAAIAAMFASVIFAGFGIDGAYVALSRSA